MIWKYQGAACNHYQVEHDLLFEAIRQDKPYNEAEALPHAALVGIMGRMAAESGKMITWDEALHSNIELAPGLDKLTMQSPPPGAARRRRPLPDRHAGVHNHSLSGPRYACGAFSPSPAGSGGTPLAGSGRNGRMRGLAGQGTQLCPHPPLRGTFSRGEKD